MGLISAAIGIVVLIILVMFLLEYSNTDSWVYQSMLDIICPDRYEHTNSSIHCRDPIQWDHDRPLIDIQIG